MVAILWTKGDVSAAAPDGPAPERTVLRAAVGADGTFSLGRPPAAAADDAYAVVFVATVARGDGAVGWAQGSVRPDRAAPDLTVTVRPAGRLVLKIRDGANRPLAGVQATGALWTAPGPDGKRPVYLCIAALAAARGVAWEPSDAAGRLELPGLWAGTSVLVTLVHPDYPAFAVSAEVPAATRDPLPAPALVSALLRGVVPTLAPVLAPGSEWFRAWLFDEPVPVKMSAGTVRVTVRGETGDGAPLPTEGYALSGKVGGNGTGGGKTWALRDVSPKRATRKPDGAVVLEWRVRTGAAEI